MWTARFGQITLWLFAVIGAVAAVVGIWDWATRTAPDVKALVLFAPVELPAGHNLPQSPAGFVQIRLTNGGPAAAQDVRLKFAMPSILIEPAPNAEGDIIFGDLHARRDRMVKVWLPSVPASWEELRDAVQVTYLGGNPEVELIIPLPFEYYKGNPGDRIFMSVAFIFITLNLMYSSRENRRWHREFMAYLRESEGTRGTGAPQ